MTAYSPEGMNELLREIDGVPVFAWWPVATRYCNGHFKTGRVAWLRWVLKKRCIAAPTYFYAELDGSLHPYQGGFR